MKHYTEFLTMLSTEFQKYLMEHDAFADHIPSNALIIFHVPEDESFNSWHREVSLRNREPDQPVVYIDVQKWRTHSLLEDVRILKMVA